MDPIEPDIPQGESSGMVVFDIVVWVFGLLFWLAAAFAVYVKIPQYRGQFLSFGVELPVITVWAIDNAKFLFPVLAVVTGAIVFAAQSRAFRGLALTLMPLIMLLVVIVCIVPVVKQMQNDFRL